MECTQAEANTVIDRLYQHEHWPSLIYAALFEFMFFTGLRLSEALAVRWDAIDMGKKTVHVKKTVALGKVEERTKTGRDRFVLLNDRALRAVQFAREYADRRRHGKGVVTETPYLFPPSKNAEYVKQTSDLHKQWVPVLNDLGIRRRPPIQLPSYLCDNMLNVRPQPRIYRPTAGSQRADAAVDVCPLAQLKLRLERAGKTQDWYQIGIS